MYLLLLISLIPMVLFVLIDYFTRNLKTSIFSAIATAIVMGGVMWYLMGEFDYEVLVIVGTMLVTGLISIKLKTPLWFKLQPVITGIVLAIIIAYFQFFDQPLMVKMMPKVIDLMEQQQLVSPQQIVAIKNNMNISLMENVTKHMIGWILIHAGLVAVCAIKFNNAIWLIAKAIGLPLVAGGTYLTMWLVS